MCVYVGVCEYVCVCVCVSDIFELVDFIHWLVKYNFLVTAEEGKI